MLSAAGDVESRVKGIDAGANDFLAKPYDGQELIARVRSLLAYKQAVDQLSTERARMSALLNQIGNPVIVTDGSGIITQVNPAAFQALNLNESIVSQGLGDVFGLGLEDLLLRARERAGTVSGVYTERDNHVEQPVTFNVSVSPIQEVGYILFWQDITALQEGERARLGVERAETLHVLDTFSRYMSPTLVERVLNDSDILNRYEKREATILFADLRGFTELSTRQSPDKVMGLLNEIYTSLLEVVNTHEGLVLDIVGDELMLAFNVPYPQDDSVQRALQTAIDMQRQFNSDRATRKKRGLQVGLGIGINGGSLVLGHIGGRSHKSYTVIGEAVNIAHRMVEMAEDRQIVTNAELLRQWQPQDGDLQVRDLDVTQLQGVADPVKLSVIEVVQQTEG
jgi:class 3 adenylate cyclase